MHLLKDSKSKAFLVWFWSMIKVINSILMVLDLFGNVKMQLARFMVELDVMDAQEMLLELGITVLCAMILIFVKIAKLQKNMNMNSKKLSMMRALLMIVFLLNGILNFLKNRIDCFFNYFKVLWIDYSKILYNYIPLTILFILKCIMITFL